MFSLSAPRRFCAPSFVRPVVCAPRRLCAPSFLLLKATLLTSLLLAAPHAQAGTYTSPSPYSGGTMTDTGHDPSYPAPIFESNTGYGAFTHVRAFTPNPCSITASGPLTATYNWQPDPNLPPALDPPPSAIMVQTCYLVWNTTSAQDGATASGSGTSGIPGAAAFASGPSGGGTVTGYSVASPSGSTVSVSCNPMLKYMGQTTDASRSEVDADATINYSVTPYPVTITVGPTILLNGVREALTGSPLTASLDALPAGCSASNYHWDIESQNGGALCSGYIAEQAEGMVIEPSTAMLENPAVTFYDGIADTVTVNLTVTITFPDNTTSPATATTQVIIVKPTLAKPIFDNEKYDNFAQHPNDTLSQYGATEKFSNIKITMPPGFTGGAGGIVQKIQSTTRVDMRQTGSNYTVQEKQSGGSWIPIPVPCLDTDFLYPFESTYSSGGTTHTGWQVADTGSGIDTPGVLCAPPLVSTDTGKSDWRISNGNDQFNDWIMYNPNPSSSCIWVPVSTFSWSWSNQASYNSTTYIWSTGTFQKDAGDNSFTTASDWPRWDTWAPFSGTGELAMRP